MNISPGLAWSVLMGEREHVGSSDSSCTVPSSQRTLDGCHTMQTPDRGAPGRSAEGMLLSVLKHRPWILRQRPGCAPQSQLFQFLWSQAHLALWQQPGTALRDWSGNASWLGRQKKSEASGKRGEHMPLSPPPSAPSLRYGRKVRRAAHAFHWRWQPGNCQGWMRGTDRWQCTCVSFLPGLGNRCNCHLAGFSITRR